MTTPEPEACPWCKHAPEIDSMIFHDIERAWYVKCKTKSCPVNPCTNTSKTREEAIAKWNSMKEPANADE